MEDDDNAIEYRDPFGVACDDSNDHVTVVIVIPNLKKHLVRNSPSDGKISFKVGERSVDLKLSVLTKESGTKKPQHYRYQIRKLPADVVPNKCHYKVKDGKVIIQLYKATKESWQSVLSESGLETYEEDQPGEKDD